MAHSDFRHLTGLILHADADTLCRLAPELARSIPELGPMIGFDQRSPHHAYDLFRHTACVTAAVPEDATLRWAALLHDTGKIAAFTLDETGRGHFYGHASHSAAIAERVLRRLEAPSQLRRDAVKLVELHMTRLVPDPKKLRQWQDRLGAEGLNRLLLLQEADMGSKGVPRERDLSQFRRLRQLLAEMRSHTI
jgi:tRNA nucleotidyltransferase (CCA-adding enzyme)